MKLDKIKLINFGSHKSTELEFGEGVTLIWGLNASGKTSITKAIEYGLTGRCIGTNMAGHGASKFIGSDGNEAIIRVDLASGLVAKRTITPDGNPASISGEKADGKGKALQMLDKETLSAADMLTALLRSGGIIDMSSKDTINLLMKAVRMELDEKTLSGMVSEATVKWLKAKTKDEKLEISGIGSIDEAYTMAFAERREVTRSIKEIGTPDDSPEEVQIDIDKAKGEVEALESQIDVAMVGGEAATELAEARIESKSLSTRIEQTNSTIVELEADNWKDIKTLANTQRGKLTTQRDKIEATLGNIQEEVSKDALAFYKLLHGAKTAGQRVDCPVLRVVGCPIPKNILPGIQDKLGASTDPGSSSLADLRKEADEISKQILNLSAQISAADESVSRIKALKTELKELQASMKASHSRISKAEVDAGATTSGPDVAELRDLLREKREIYQKAMEDKAKYEAAGANKTKLKNLTAIKDILDVVVDELGSGGAKVKALSMVLGPIINVAKDHLKRAELVMEIEYDPWNIRVGGLDTDMLSYTERMKVSTAIQLAVAEAVGVGFLLVDQADVLDDIGRIWLLDFLMKKGIQAIVLFTAPDDYRKPDSIPGYLVTKEKGVSSVVAV